MNGPNAPVRLLIAALGGEGGGVLADWVSQAAQQAGLPAQATSVPGVAQRTGATSYYIEFLPLPPPEDSEPVFALTPVAGRVDAVISSELLETGRLLERGFVSPDRTLLISSSSRALTTAEKMQMGDGRFDSKRLHAAARELARTYISLDLEQLAQAHGTVISAPMFGALAGAGAFPWPRETCEQVIAAGGRGVSASLAGFAAAFDAVRQTPEARSQGAEPQDAETLTTGDAASARQDSSAGVDAIAPDGGFAGLSGETRALIAHGLARTRDFQDEAYGELYLERMRALSAAAASHVDDPRVDHALGEAARRLALWMAYEDIPRVADLKTRRDRFARIGREASVQTGQVLRVYEYLKPGLAEIADMMPGAVGRWMMRRAEAGKRLPFVGKGKTLATTTVSGFYTLRLLARLRRFRRRSLRYRREQDAIDQWLATMTTALARSPEFAGALAELPRVRKGYGETQARGLRNYDAIFATVVTPAIAAGAEAASASRLRKATGAALADPEGETLARTLSEAPNSQSTPPVVA